MQRFISFAAVLAAVVASAVSLRAAEVKVDPAVKPYQVVSGVSGNLLTLA